MMHASGMLPSLHLSSSPGETAGRLFALYCTRRYSKSSCDCLCKCTICSKGITFATWSVWKYSLMLMVTTRTIEKHNSWPELLVSICSWPSCLFYLLYLHQSRRNWWTNWFKSLMDLVLSKWYPLLEQCICWYSYHSPLLIRMLSGRARCLKLCAKCRTDCEEARSSFWNSTGI